MIKYFFQIGLNADDSQELRSQVQLANKLNFILAAIDIVYLIKSYLQNYPTSILLLFLGFSSFCVIVFLLTSSRQFQLARFILAVCPGILSSVLYASVSQGVDDVLLGSAFMVYTACSIPFMLFSFKEKGMLFGSFAFCAMIILLLRDINIWIDIPFENVASKSLGNYYFTIVLALIALFSSMYVLLGNLESQFSKNSSTILDLERINNDATNSRLKLEETIKEVEKANEEEKRRKWASDGISQIAEILRTQNDSKWMYEHITSFISKYLGANQAALFIMEELEGRSILELKATFAYDRKKYVEKTIEIGEGMIGQCFLEKEPILLKKVPPNYVHITSGLGEATASCVAIIPLKIEQKVEGILELAAFRAFEDYEIIFLLKIGENISSMVNSMKINGKTKKLYEQSQMQSEQMRAQEEEMRQNLEELIATQEEMMRKEGEMRSQSELLELIIDNIPFPVFIKDGKGVYTLVNKAEADIFDVDKSEILGFDDSKFVIDATEMARIRESDRKIVQENVAVNFPEQYLTLENGTVKVFKTSKIPFLNKTTNQVNILGVSVDLSDTKNVERELKHEIESLKERIGRV
ncbi:MAG: PAS domain-containing protein [Cytophagales bacterium]